MNTEKEELNTVKLYAEEALRRSQKQLREFREEFAEMQKKEAEANHKKTELVNSSRFRAKCGL